LARFEVDEPRFSDRLDAVPAPGAGSRPYHLKAVWDGVAAGSWGDLITRGRPGARSVSFAASRRPALRHARPPSPGRGSRSTA
jgi:hypothetical protein